MLIKPRDLRIGNLVKFEGAIYEIDSVSSVFPTLNTDAFGIGVVDWFNIAPVNLTKELIEKFGFSDKDYKEGFIGIDCNNTDFVLSKPTAKVTDEAPKHEKYYTFHFDYGGWPRVMSFKYAHELQNFFYALMGAELKLNN